MNKKTLLLSIFAILALLLGACGQSETTQGEKEKKVIKIGVTGGPSEEVTDFVKKVAEKEGIILDVVKFNDIATPNQALANGEIDVNMFQHLQFLNKWKKDRKKDLVPVGKTWISNASIFSENHKSLDDIPDGATLAIASDPSNLWRSLLVYEEVGFIKLKPGVEEGNVNDIIENPRKFQFKEIDGAVMVRSLKHFDAGVVANSRAHNMGLKMKDALYIDKGEEYPMVLATNAKDKDNPDYKRLVELYHTDEVKQYILDKYEDAFVPTDELWFE